MKLHLKSLVFAVSILLPAAAPAIDPPHVTADLCGSCHIPHSSPGGNLTAVAGDANVCLSCHQSGGSASTFPFASSDQALPYPGLPTNVVGAAASGTSHRWDASAAGHVQFLGGAVTPSTGSVKPLGTYTGYYPKVYTLTITTAGASGVARFGWLATIPGGGAGTNVLTGASVLLDAGVSVKFLDGAATSFQLGDKWNLYVRAGVRQPTNTTMLAHMVDGVVTCSACHDGHSQEFTPFDATASAYGGRGTGSGRHFMRMNTQTDQMCVDCHAGMNATNALTGTHPVGIKTPVDAKHKSPTLLPTQTGTTNFGCLSCHDVHKTVSTDGKLTRVASSRSLCIDCHTLADTATPAAHFSTTNSATLWPGGRRGSLLPARTNVLDQGSCVNCHPVHGWPDTAAPTNHYPKLLADFEERMCFSCHGTNGPAVKQVEADFAKQIHHRVVDAQQVGVRSVECSDCHNAHKAKVGTVSYTNTATATRNLVDGPMLGVSGVAVNFTALTNFQAITTNLYTLIPASPGATYEYQICFKCHSSYGWVAGVAPNGVSANGSVATPIETDLALEFSPKNKSGHPIVVGLDSYSNSIAVGGKRGLLAAAMKAPWNVNLGTQTMMCADCHSTDAALPAAQGPHGSAAQFMLRGTNANNWPNVTLANYNNSWCANCHNKSTHAGHSEGDHSSSQCYVCHIVVPHGGKMSRLIADRDGTMPTRYAYNNTLTTVGMQQFTKAAVGSYSENNSCRTSCGHHATGTGTENW